MCTNTLLYVYGKDACIEAVTVPPGNLLDIEKQWTVVVKMN